MSTIDRRFRRAVVGLLALLLMAALVGCELLSACPRSVDEALASGVPGQNEATLIAVGRASRFVPAAAEEHRGYDLDIRRALVGDAADPTLFLRLPEPLPGIRRGSPVLVMAEQGPEPLSLVPGACQPLQPISEAELIRWSAR